MYLVIKKMHYDNGSSVGEDCDINVVSSRKAVWEIKHDLILSKHYERTMQTTFGKSTET